MPKVFRARHETDAPDTCLALAAAWASIGPKPDMYLVRQSQCDPERFLGLQQPPDSGA